VLNNGRWGTVCSTSLDDVSAEVACRHLGYTGGQFRWQGNITDGIDPIWMKDLNCSSNSISALFMCSFSSSTGSCGHSQDVGLGCENATSASQQNASPGIRLVKSGNNQV